MAINPTLNEIYVGYKSGCVGTENMDSYIFDDVNKLYTKGEVEAYEYFKIGTFKLNVAPFIAKYSKYIDQTSLPVRRALTTEYTLYAKNKITSVVFYTKSTSGTPPVSTYKKLASAKLIGIIPSNLYVATIKILTDGLKNDYTIQDILTEKTPKIVFNDLFGALINTNRQDIGYMCNVTNDVSIPISQSAFPEVPLIIAEYNGSIYTNLSNTNTDLGSNIDYLNVSGSSLSAGTVPTEDIPTLNYRAIIYSTPLSILF